MKRVIGLDLGSKTVGVAVSDPLLLTAGPVEIIRRQSENKLRRTLARICELVRQYDAGLIVLGLPVHMNSELSDRARKSLEFKEMLQKRTGLNVVMWDERLTSVEAEQMMREAHVEKNERKNRIDAIAAAVILQDWLNDRAIKEKSGEQVENG